MSRESFSDKIPKRKRNVEGVKEEEQFDIGEVEKNLQGFTSCCRDRPPAGVNNLERYPYML